MKVGILGSGFGLYGYLPAVVSGCGEQVVLPQRYREKLRSRADVARFDEVVEWTADAAAVLDTADAVILTQRPGDQVRLVAECVARESLRRVLLEKPIAPDPASAAALLDQLAQHGKTVRVGYTFRYTSWGAELLRDDAGTKAAEPIEIEWLFRAHHYATGAQNWKRNVSTGGGAVRFFGIHLIALLAELGYTEVAMSDVGSEHPDEAERWQATFAGPGGRVCRITVNSNADTERFAVRRAGQSIEWRDPFQDSVSIDGLDRRVSGLTELCRDFLYGASETPAWYRTSVDLWAAVERSSGAG